MLLWKLVYYFKLPVFRVLTTFLTTI